MQTKLLNFIPTRLALIILLTFLGGCAASNLPKKLTASSSYDIESIKINLNKYQSDSKSAVDQKVRDFGIPKAGEKNFYGIDVSAELDEAYRSYLQGNIDVTLKALDRLDRKTIDLPLQWQSVFLRIQALISAGLGQDALELSAKCKSLEISVFGSDLSCTSLNGEVYLWLEQYEKAKDEFMAVLQATSGWEFRGNYNFVPTNFNNLVAVTTAQIRAITGVAGVYYFTGNFKESHYWAVEAQKRIDTVISVVNDPLYGLFIKPHLDLYYGTGTVMTLHASNLLALNIQVGEVDKLYNKAVEYYNVIGNRRGVAYTLTTRAFSYLHSQRLENGIVESKRALDYAKKYGFMDLVWRIEVTRGIVYFNNRNLDKAEDAFRSAQQTVRLISNTLRTDNSKTHFGSGKEAITQYLIKIDLAKNDISSLFSDLEEGRSRVFLDLYSGSVIASEDNKYLNEIKSVDQQISNLSLQTNTSYAKDEKYSELDQLRNNRMELVSQLKKESPRLASAVSVWNSKLTDFQRNLSDGQDAIYYFSTEDDEPIQYLYITNKTYKVESTHVTPKALEKKLGNLFESIAISDNKVLTRGLKLKKSASPPQNNKVEFTEQKDALAKDLNLHERLNKGKTYIVPNGMLNFMPWSIFDSSGAISILSSASILNFKHINYPISSAVIVGNPDFGGVLPQLEGSEAEAKFVSTIYNTDPLVNQNATMKNIRKSLGNGVNVLHLATHGIFDQNNPLLSSIYLSENGKPYALSAKEIYENPLKAHLVVLSACETGLGSSISGDELLGLNRSFFLGGANSVLSSLWEVDDLGTTEFMKIFHSYAKSGKYSTGFKMARDTLKDRGYPPSVYAAFVLSGTDLQ